MLNAKNGKIKIDDTYASYITFGRGKKNLIIIPGLGDGFASVNHLAIPFSIMYKIFSYNYKVYVFSRRYDIKEGFKTYDMALDIIKHMDDLGITKANIVGVSEGGMIAEEVAINAPEKVDKLVLIVTTPRPNEILENNINKWVEMALNKEYKNIMIDTIENSYVGSYLKKGRKLYKTFDILAKKATYERFIIEAKACLTHNTYERLDKILAKTLVIGAKKDKIVGYKGSIELHEGITDSELYLYEDYGHGVYEEAIDFNRRVLEFLNK